MNVVSYSTFSDWLFSARLSHCNHQTTLTQFWQRYYTGLVFVSEKKKKLFSFVWTGPNKKTTTKNNPKTIIFPNFLHSLGRCFIRTCVWMSASHTGWRFSPGELQRLRQTFCWLYGKEHVRKSGNKKGKSCVERSIEFSDYSKSSFNGWVSGSCIVCVYYCFHTDL